MCKLEAIFLTDTPEEIEKKIKQYAFSGACFMCVVHERLAGLHSLLPACASKGLHMFALPAWHASLSHFESFMTEVRFQVEVLNRWQANGQGAKRERSRSRGRALSVWQLRAAYGMVELLVCPKAQKLKKRWLTPKDVDVSYQRLVTE